MLDGQRPPEQQPPPRRISRRSAAGAALGLALLTAGCGAAGVPATPAASAGAAPAPAGRTSGLTRKSDAAQVTVEVTPASPPAAGQALTFKVLMDTHSVDLDGYDLSRLAALRVDGGKDVAPSAWNAPKGGHHREGTLTFPALDGGGPAIPGGAKSVVLVIRDIAGVAERSFTWTL